MAKLSDRQKNNIIAKWNTGQYSKLQLAKTYKVSDVMIGKIVGKEQPLNAHIVEASLIIEKVKKFEKSSSDVQAIEQAVKYRLDKEFNDDNKRVKIYDLTDTVLENVLALLNKGKKQIVVKTKNYVEGKADSESLDTVDIDLDMTDLKNAQETIDKASITNNTNARHAPKQDINLTNAIQNNVDAPRKGLSDFYKEVNNG